MKTIFLSKKIGPNLSTRRAAASLREELVSSSEPVVIDFSGVELISHSFADELFGKLAEKFGLSVFRDRFHLAKLNDNDRMMLRTVVSDRLEPKAG